MSIQIVWNGTDGSVWDFVGGPVGMTLGGIKGLGMPDVDDQVRETALRDGQTLTGWKLKPRRVWVPLRFRQDAEQDVEGVQRAFWRSMEIGVAGRLDVTDDDGAVRSLGLRFQDDGGMSYRLDPHVLSEAFGVTMVADQPWWEGETQEFAYAVPTATESFFGGAGSPSGATPFVISAGGGQDDATLTNPGDAPAWLEWEVDAPATAFSLGVDGHYVAGTINISTGSLIIETDPLRQIATLNGVRVTRQLSALDWAPIPKGATLPIEITVTGTGIVKARLTPRYARAL